MSTLLYSELSGVLAFSPITLEQPQSLPKLLTVRQVAKRLQMPVWTASRKVESGKIPSVRLGSAKRSPIRVDPDELYDWIFGERS